MRFGTKLIHNGYDIDPHTGALSVPIYQTSTFHQEDIDNPPEFDYARSGNPTRKALEETIALLEGGEKAYAFSSGMAAISGALSLFSAGDHLIVCEDVYGGTFRALNNLFSKFDIQTTFVDTTNTGLIQEKIQRNTKGIFLETPSNPLLKITDLKEVLDIARKHQLLSIVDNTFMSPYLQQPLKLGADIVVHSATKFIGGHSDVVGGIVVTKTEELGKRIYAVQNGFGGILGPMDCWLLLRGVKTLKVRLDVQQKNASLLAEWLEKHPNVSKVYYPGLESHKNRDIHFAQCDGPGAVLSFTTQDVETAKRFMKEIKLAAVAVSLGGVETIVSYPVKMSHAAIPKVERERLGITDNLIRVSLGVEDIEDIFADFTNALK